VIAEPAVTRPILDALSADPELYVRKSVANHLNDLSKFDPAYMLALCSSWDRGDARTAWIIRHASRTLIKNGHEAALLALDFERLPKFRLQGVKVAPLKVKIGGNMQVAFGLFSAKNRTQKLAIDYRIHYCKSKGRTVKTFKLRECSLKAGGSVSVKKTISFADLSTRKHYPGGHLFELLINGKVGYSVSFRLLS
jgi:hypothetical protein